MTASATFCLLAKVRLPVHEKIQTKVKLSHYLVDFSCVGSGLLVYFNKLTESKNPA